MMQDRGFRRRPRLLAAGTLFLTLSFAVAGCSDSSDSYLDGGVDGAVSTDAGGSNKDGSSGGDMMGTGGLPCDVAQLLVDHCQSCHGAPPKGAPIALVTYQDLTKPSAVMPTQSVAARSLARMMDTTRPMPPGPTPTINAAGLKLFSDWIAAGTPMATGSCVPPTDPFKLPPQCSTGKSWTDGDRGDKTMHPGKACIACHSSRKGPTFQIAGTVYQTGHEPDDCVGGPAMGSATVEVTDAAGMVVTITPNSSGNFSSRTALKLPYTAKVKFAGRERVMSGAQMSGDCNSCHTQTGTNYAPGRIVLP